MTGQLTKPREWAVRFPMKLYICPWCGDVLRLPDGRAPYRCVGTEGIDRHPGAELLPFVVAATDAESREQRS